MDYNHRPQNCDHKNLWIEIWRWIFIFEERLCRQMTIKTKNLFVTTSDYSLTKRIILVAPKQCQTNFKVTQLLNITRLKGYRFMQFFHHLNDCQMMCLVLLFVSNYDCWSFLVSHTIIIEAQFFQPQSYCSTIKLVDISSCLDCEMSVFPFVTENHSSTINICH